MNGNSKNNAVSFGFTTASGSSINVSNKALSKARRLFTEELEEADNYEKAPKTLKRNNEPNAQTLSTGFRTANSRHINESSKALLNAKILMSDETVDNTKHVPSVGFKTATGNSINISEEALSTAKQLFINDVEDTYALEEPFVNKNQINEPEMQVQNIGFQTASGQSVNITKDVLLKAKTLLSDEVVDNINIIPSIGFKTATGESINISAKALSSAKQLFINDVEDTDATEEPFVNENQINEPKMQIQNIGFQTANGQGINIKRDALLKAKVLLSDETIENKKNVLSIGFKTASGSSVTVTEKALSIAKRLFTNDLEDTHAFEEPVETEKQINVPEMQVRNIGFQTASGQSVNVTNDALLKAEALYYEESSNSSENNSLLPKSLQKRKIKDLDDDISLNKQLTSNHFKKLRFSKEFHIQKTICKDQENNVGKENLTLPSVSPEVSSTNYGDNKLINITCNTETSKRSNQVDSSFLISHEIEASTFALLADEKSSNSCEQWLSPIECKQSNGDSHVPSSPVIGGHFIPKKRKKSINVVKKKENRSINTDNVKQLNNNCVTLGKHVKEEHKLLTEKQELTDKENKCDKIVANEFGDTQLMLDFINESATILEKRLEAAVEQEKQISLKKTCKVKPTISKLYFHKRSNCNNRVSWKEISKGNIPIPCTSAELIEQKLPPEILNVTADNAVTYKFRCTDFYGQDMVQNNIEGIKLEDGACLILDENGYVGISEIKRSLLAGPGVDPNLLPTGWVENHYKWIVWKLVSMNRIKFGSIKLPRVLTPARVMMELKYRYDREIDRSQRPALRKILEKDDIASKRMVLCVSSISEYDESGCISSNPNQLKTSSKKLILTDGWYSVQAFIDQAMIKNITSGKIKEGTKIMTYGSELINCDQGCSPLEIPENVCLKIHTNSTRRAKWDTKLGYITPPGPMCIKLGSICSNGGLIGKIEVLITRVYPILYHEKTSTGESIFRNARCEEKADIAYEKQCRSMIEAFYAKAEEYFTIGKKISNSNPDSLDLAAIEWNEDRDKLSKEEFSSKQEQEHLINKCRMKEETLRRKLESRLQESLPPARQVTPLLKIRVIEEETTAILSIWSPNEEITDILKEGNYISICNIMPSGKRGNELQLTASRNAVFNKKNVPNVLYPSRTYTAICDVNKPTFTPPVYGEFDTVGIVASIGNEVYGMKNFEAIHLAYPHTNSESSYLSILFWHGLASHGYAEILTVGSFVACSNIEWRRATSWNIPIAYCTERSTFTRSSRQNHLQQPFEDLKRLVMDTGTYVTTCAAEISEEVQKKSLTRMSNQCTPNRNNFEKISCNETFNSDKQCDSYVCQELPGRSLINNQSAKSVAIQKRLEKLQYYGEPSRLSPIVLNNSSKRVSLDFQSPLRSSDSGQLKPHISSSSKFLPNSR